MPEPILSAIVPAGMRATGIRDPGVLAGGHRRWELGTVGVGDGGSRWRRVAAQDNLTGVAYSSTLHVEAEIQTAEHPDDTARAIAASIVQDLTRPHVSLPSNPDTVAQGGSVTYRMTVTYIHNTDIGGVELASRLPDKIRYTRA